jgi:hypothetical protein
LAAEGFADSVRPPGGTETAVPGDLFFQYAPAARPVTGLLIVVRKTAGVCILVRVLYKKASDFPVVTVTEPRQAGKTTLCRAPFPNKPPISFLLATVSPLIATTDVFLGGTTLRNLVFSKAAFYYARY